MNTHRTALIIDDEPSVAELCERVLIGDGFTVTVAITGKMAEEMVSENSYDLIMCDIRLPEENGIEFFNWLKAERPDQVAHVIFMSGSVMGAETTEFLNSCGRPYLLKPFRPTELTEIVRKNIED